MTGQFSSGPDYAEAWYNRGIALDKDRQYREAVESYDRAVAIRPDYIMAWNNRGIALEGLGQLHRRRLNHMTGQSTSTRIMPMHGTTAGSVLLQTGEVTEAIASFEIAIALNPEHGRARDKPRYCTPDAGISG